MTCPPSDTLRRVTPDELREIARVLDEEGKKLVESGEPVKGARAFKTAQDYREAAATLEGLTPGNQSGTSKEMVSTAARLRISEATGGEDGPDPLVQAANAKGYTLRSLGEAVGVSHALLSQARSGGKAIRQDVAAAVEKLTGFKASRKNWPRGWARPRK